MSVRTITVYTQPILDALDNTSGNNLSIVLKIDNRLAKQISESPGDNDTVSMMPHTALRISTILGIKIQDLLAEEPSSKFKMRWPNGTKKGQQFKHHFGTYIEGETSRENPNRNS